MTEDDWRAAALEAFQSGDKERTGRILAGYPQELLGDCLSLQLAALSSENPHEARALLELGACDLFPNVANVHFNLGVIEQELGLLSAAMRSYTQVLRLEPLHEGALNNLSDLFRRHNRPAEAWRLVERYLSAGYPAAGFELRFAKIADDLGLVEEAAHWFDAALSAGPGNPSNLWEKAMGDLRDERFAEGWSGYEARQHRFDHALLGQVAYPMPLWDGSPLAGRSLLLHKEQGLGDMIMFASCLPDISRHKGDDIHIAVQPPLVRLFALNFPWAKVWSSVSTADRPDWRGQSWLDVAGPVDLAFPLASLGLLTRQDGFPSPSPYLAADPADIAGWERRLDALGLKDRQNLRAGLVVSARRDGSDADGVADGLAKSLPAMLAARLVDTTPIDWIALHDRRTADQLACVPLLDPFDVSAWLLDLADTAALIASLDVVVAVDTAVAHLAGAMGKKVLLMLRRNSDWRWGRTRDTAIWYADVEIFRQIREGDWSDVIDRVRDRLRELSAHRPWTAEGLQP